MRMGLMALALATATPAAAAQRDRRRPVTVDATGALVEGEASWYGPGFAGRKTANGEIYDPSELTAAHKTLPFGTVLEVTNLDNGRSVIVRVNDRGPYAGDRVIDLSQRAALDLGMIDRGVATVRAVELSPEAAEPPVVTPRLRRTVRR